MEHFPIEYANEALGYIALDERLKKQIEDVIRHNSFSDRYKIHPRKYIYLKPINIGKLKPNIIGFEIKIK